VQHPFSGPSTPADFYASSAGSDRMLRDRLPFHAHLERRLFVPRTTYAALAEVIVNS
jgi:hypothetical protein